MRVEIDLTNPKGQLRPGMNGRVTSQLQNRTAGVVRIPRSATLQRTGPRDPELPPDHVWVYVVREGKAHRTEVIIGRYAGDSQEVVSGLRPTDFVVVDASQLGGVAVPVTITKGAAPE